MHMLKLKDIVVVSTLLSHAYQDILAEHANNSLFISYHDMNMKSNKGKKQSEKLVLRSLYGGNRPVATLDLL
jgi:hypothetical protein